MSSPVPPLNRPHRPRNRPRNHPRQRTNVYILVAATSILVLIFASSLDLASAHTRIARSFSRLGLLNARTPNPNLNGKPKPKRTLTLTRGVGMAIETSLPSSLAPPPPSSPHATLKSVPSFKPTITPSPHTIATATATATTTTTTTQTTTTNTTQTTPTTTATLNGQPITRMSDKAARRAKFEEAFVKIREELVGHMRDEGMPREAVEWFENFYAPTSIFRFPTAFTSLLLRSGVLFPLWRVYSADTGSILNASMEAGRQYAWAIDGMHPRYRDPLIFRFREDPSLVLRAPYLLPSLLCARVCVRLAPRCSFILLSSPSLAYTRRVQRVSTLFHRTVFYAPTALLASLRPLLPFSPQWRAVSHVEGVRRRYGIDPRRDRWRLVVGMLGPSIGCASLITIILSPTVRIFPRLTTLRTWLCVLLRPPCSSSPIHPPLPCLALGTSPRSAFYAPTAFLSSVPFLLCPPSLFFVFIGWDADRVGDTLCRREERSSILGIGVQWSAVRSGQRLVGPLASRPVASSVDREDPYPITSGPSSSLHYTLRWLYSSFVTLLIRSSNSRSTYYLRTSFLQSSQYLRFPSP
ncbi:hypothetical protein NMY22_g12332 [Coprinellus aureogranulatus]|nr:hypothetical protein NMY22_g12332 [Coprinellus aureogranulatus]